MIFYLRGQPFPFNMALHSYQSTDFVVVNMVTVLGKHKSVSTFMRFQLFMWEM